jgi:hypothetical protein
MFQFQNILLHPKTTIAGLLIAITTIAGVLTGQGITLGHAGTGTVVALLGALATAGLGAIARDPLPATLAPLPAKAASPVANIQDK